mgnify:FL=1
MRGKGERHYVFSLSDFLGSGIIRSSFEETRKFSVLGCRLPELWIKTGRSHLMVLSTGAQRQFFCKYDHVAVLSVSESTRRGKRISCLEHGDCPVGTETNCLISGTATGVRR